MFRSANKVVTMTATKKQPSGTKRQKPGSTGKGDYYHVEVLSKTGITTFRTQDVGDPGHIQRVAGKKVGGSWVTVKWLIGKEDAHVRGDRLVPDSKDAKNLIKELGVQPVHISGDRFKAKPTVKTDGGRSTAKRGRTAKPKSKGS
jgi:hypothetical protein